MQNFTKLCYLLNNDFLEGAELFCYKIVHIIFTGLKVASNWQCHNFHLMRCITFFVPHYFPRLKVASTNLRFHLACVPHLAVQCVILKNATVYHQHHHHHHTDNDDVIERFWPELAKGLSDKLPHHLQPTKSPSADMKSSAFSSP